AAPRLSASIPSAPLPANRSSTRAPIIASPRLEKIAALTRSIVGRTPCFGTARRSPPALPAITLMATVVDLVSRWLQEALPPAARMETVQQSHLQQPSFSFSAEPFFRRRS